MRKVRIYPRGHLEDSARTISGFLAEQLASSIPIMIFRTILAAFLDPLALLRTKFAFWFPPFSNRIRTEDSCPSARKIRARPHGRSVPARTEDPRPPAQKFRGARVENPRHSTRNNHGILQKKLSFPCHMPTSLMLKPLS